MMRNSNNNISRPTKPKERRFGVYFATSSSDHNAYGFVEYVKMISLLCTKKIKKREIILKNRINKDD